MWNKITGKSDASSHDGRRKDQRRRTGSTASSHASRNPTRLEDRSDYPPTLSSRSTTYPQPPSSASIASYATAPDRRSTMDYDIQSEWSAAYDDREHDPRSTRTDKRRDDNLRTERSSKHRERSASRDRKRDRDDTEREHKEEGKKDAKDGKDGKDGKERRDRDHSSKKSYHKSRARTSSKASDAIVDEPVRYRGDDSLQRGDSYTSQTTHLPYRAPTRSTPTTPGYEGLDAHVGGQFADENPTLSTAAYRPSLGEATSYYGDQGESVQHQPGVRLEDPDMLINAHNHLITPSVVPNPPEDTGHGSAAEFFSGNFDVDVGEIAPAKPPGPESMPGSFEPDERPKPSRKTSKTEKIHKISSAASAAGSAALDYALGRHSSHDQSGSTHVTSSLEEHVENYTSHSGNYSGKYSTSYWVPPGDAHVPAAGQSSKLGESYSSQVFQPGYSQSYSVSPSGDYIPAASHPSKPGHSQSYSIPPSGNYVPADMQSNKPGKSSHSNAGLYAGAAGLATGYGLHKLHSSHHDSPALPPRPNHNHAGSRWHSYAALGMQRKQTGPVSKFVDWWKDHEDVRKMEEYTEYIGVCRDCFDPREPPSMAPRKHHYHHHHKRRSNGSLRSNRVDKESRYHYSSSEEDGRRKSNSWVAKGLAGYGLAKVGKALWWQNQDFDDTHSAKSGRRARSSRSVGRRSRSRSGDRTSVTSRGVIRHRSNSRDPRAGRHYSRTTRDYKIVHHRGRSESRSRDTKSGLFSAAGGAALGASLAGRSKNRSRSRSKSPRREYVTKNSYVEKPRSSGSALGVADARRFSSRLSMSSTYAENKSHRSSNQGSYGVFGMFSGAASSNERNKTHAKKKKGFFTFTNGSSSSTDSGLVYGSPELRRRSSELRRKGSHKKRRNSDDKLNTALLGLGATAAALAAVQGRRDEKSHSKGRPGPEVFAVRESKDRRRREKRQHMPGASATSSSGDDEWEEVSDAGDDSASVDTGLAFGDYAHSIKSRKSVESLRSDASGTNKWDWRWGSKKDKRKRTLAESLKNGAHVDDRNSVSSVPTLQSVYPVPTSDPTLFDAARRSISIASTPQPPYVHPLVASAPEPVPLQQPQPIMPVSNSIYTSQAPVPSYMAPSGPPVFSSSRPPMATSRDSCDYFRAEERPMSSPRRDEPSTPMSSWKRDATIAGIAAATGAATAIAHSHASSKAGSSSPSQSTASKRVSSPSSVRFDLTKEQEAKEDRQRRRGPRKKEEGRTERDRLRRLEDEAKVREAIKLAEAERLAAITRDAEEAQAQAREQREQEARSYAASEMERETLRIQREREVIARQATEAERAAREEAERMRLQSEAATRQRERLEREILEADLRRRECERAEAEAEEPKSLESEYNVESRERQLEQREVNIVEPDKYSSWKEPAAAAGIATGATVAAAGLAHRRRGKQEKEPRDESARVGKGHSDDEHFYGEPVFDPDYFRKKNPARPSSRDRENDIVRKAASKVLATSFDDSSSKVFEDFEERYSEPRRKQSMAEFFSPSELSDRKNSISRDYFGPNADAKVETSYNVPRIATVKPPYAPEYSFTATHDPDEAYRCNDIPRLNLIEPTPPVSIAGSIRGDRSHPTSPSIPANQEPIKAVEEQIDPDDKQPKRPGVTWGVDETHYFDASTPDNIREHFVSDQDLRKNALEEWTRRKEHEQQEQQLHDEIVVEHDSPGSSRARTSYHMSPERSYAEAKPSPKPELDRKLKPRSSDDDSPVEEIKRFEDDGRPVIDATSPERTPVILSPSEERTQFYQSPFFETVSDFTTAFGFSPTESASGFVEELESDERPEANDRGMPGAWGFQEEGIASNPFSDTRAVVEELSSPTDPPRVAKDPELQPKVEEVEDQAFEKPLSKREQREKDRAAKRSSVGRDDISSVASALKDEPYREELWEDTKSKKKKMRSWDSFGLDTESASSASVTSTPVGEEPTAKDWREAPLSKKDKRKKKEREREEKRKQRDRESTDIQPSITTTSGSQSPSGSGLATAADSATVLVYAAGAGVSADAITSSRHKNKYPEESRGREQESRQPPYPIEDPHVPFTQTSGTYGSDGEHTPSGTFTSTAPYIPSRAFDDIEELADAKKPSKKGKRRSKYGSPSPGSPLRTEVAFEDYVGMDAAAAATAALPHDSSAVHQTSDYAEAVNAPLPKDDASFSSRESGKDVRPKMQHVFDEPEEAGVPLPAWQAEDEDKFERATFSDRDEHGKYRRGSRQESEGGSRERDARSTTSENRAFDEEGRRKHRHHRRRESERSDSTRDVDTRSVVSEGRYDDEGHRKHKHRKHRSAGVDKDDVGAIAAEFRDDEDDERRRHRHKKRVDIEPTIPERPRSDPGVDVDRDGEERRKHKRRSKREGERDDDVSSVVSGPAKYSEKERDKRISLFSSLFGRSSKESVVSRESKDDRSIDDDEERKHRRRKHRSSTLPSSHASDDDGISNTSRRSSSRREKTARDDSGMDYSSRRHEHDKVFDNNPSRVSASPFSAVGDESVSPVFPGSFPIEKDGFGSVFETKGLWSSSPLSHIDGAVHDILSTSKQIYTTTAPAATAAAPSAAYEQLRDSVTAATSSQPESFLSRRARGPEAKVPASSSLISPPLPTPSTEPPTSREQHAQKSPPVSASTHRQHAPSTAASLLSLGNEHDPEFDEAFPIFTALPPSRPESPTDADERRTTSTPQILGINTNILKQQGEVTGSPTGLRSPSTTAIPLRFRIGASRSVSASGSANASGVQSPIASTDLHPSYSGALAMMIEALYDEDHQHQQPFGGGVFPASPRSPLEEQQQRYFAQQASPWLHDIAASSPMTMNMPIQPRHVTASLMPSPTAIPNPFFRPRPASSIQNMHKKTSSASVISTGKEFRPLYLVESVRGRSKSSPVGIRGKERWSEEAWAEGRDGEMGDEIAVEDLPALPGSRSGSETSVQRVKSANGGRDGGDLGDAVKPEPMESAREPSDTAAPASTTSTNVFDFLVQDDEEENHAGTDKEVPAPAPESLPSGKASSNRSSSKAPSVKSASSSLFGGLFGRSSSKKSKKGKKAKDLGTVSPPRSFSPPQRDPEQDLAWRERDMANAVEDWFKGDDKDALAKPVVDVAVSSAEPEKAVNEEDTAPKEVQVPPALLARHGKGTNKAKSKGSRTKVKKGKDKGKREAGTDIEVGDSNLFEMPMPDHDESEEPPSVRPQETSSRNSGFDRDVDRDLRKDLGQEQYRRGNKMSPTRSSQVPQASTEDNDVLQTEAPRHFGIPRDEPVVVREEESGPPWESVFYSHVQTQPRYPVPPELDAYLEPDEYGLPSSVPAPEPVSTSVPKDRSTEEYHGSPKNRLENDDAVAVGADIAGAATATAALVAAQEHGDYQKSTASPVAEEQSRHEPPADAEPTGPAEDDSDDLNPVLAPARVSKKDKRKAKKKKKILGLDSNTPTPHSATPATVSDHSNWNEQEASGLLLPESKPVHTSGDERDVPEPVSSEESKKIEGITASTAFQDDVKIEQTRFEPAESSRVVDDAPPQTVKSELDEKGLGLGQIPEVSLIPIDGQASTSLEVSGPHHAARVQTQRSPEIEPGQVAPRHDVDFANEKEDHQDERSIPVGQQYDVVTELASSTPLPASPPSSPPSLPITSAVMESIFLATERGPSPRGLSDFDESEKLGRDNVANMPMREVGEDEVEVGTEKQMMEKSTSDNSRKMPIPSTYLAESIIQEPSSIGQSTPSSGSVDTPPANSATAPTTPITTITKPGKKGKKRSSSVAQVTAAPSEPLHTLAASPPVQKARKRAEPKAREEFIPSLDDVVMPPQPPEPVAAHSLPLSGDDENGATSKPEPIAARSLPLAGEDKEGATSTPGPEMLESGVNTPPVHAVFEMGQAVQVEVTFLTEKPTPVEVGQAMPVSARAERPVPVEVEPQSVDDHTIARESAAENAGLETEVSKENKASDQDVVAAKERLEALRVGAPLEVVMKDLPEANVGKEQEYERLQGQSRPRQKIDLNKELPPIPVGRPDQPEKAGEDQWAMSGKKKGKNDKGKNGKRVCFPSTPQEPEPEPESEVPALVPSSEPNQDSTVAPLIEQPREQIIMEEGVSDPVVAPREAGEDEWAVTISKKSKKGKQVKCVSVLSSPPPDTFSEFVEPVDPLQEPALDEHAERSSTSHETELPVEQLPEQKIVHQEDEIAIPSAAPVEAAVEDEWSIPSGKKKGKKGKRGKLASLPVSPLAIPEPEPSAEPFTSNQESDVQAEEAAPLARGVETASDLFASNHEEVPVEAGEDELPMPSKKKKGKRFSLLSSPAPECESEVGALPLETAQKSTTRGNVDLEPPATLKAGEDEWSVPVKKKGKKGKKLLPVTPTEPTPKPHVSQNTFQPADEPTSGKNREVADSPREAIGEQAAPQEEGEKEIWSLPNSPHNLEEIERQDNSNDEYFIDPNDVLKYRSIASAHDEPSLAEAKAQESKALGFSYELVVSDVEPEMRDTHPSSPREEFIDPSDVLKYATASQTGEEPSVGAQQAGESNDPKLTSLTESPGLHQRYFSPAPEPVLEQPLTVEPLTPGDDSDMNPVLAPAKVFKKDRKNDRKKTKKKGKPQAPLADYAPLDSSQNATDTEPLLARENSAGLPNEPWIEPPNESKNLQDQSPKMPTTTAEDQRTMPTPVKKSTKEKKKEKKSKGISSPPLPPHEGDVMAGVQYFSPTEETGRGLHDDPLSLGHVGDSPPVVAEKAADADYLDLSKAGLSDSRGTLQGDGSRQHAEPFQSVEAGPSLTEPVIEIVSGHEDLPSTNVKKDQPISGQQHLETASEERAKTRGRDVEFAATVAAGLEGAGLDANFVLNDPSFAERKSPPCSVGEADPGEVAIPKRPWKRKSTDAVPSPIEQDKRSPLAEDKVLRQDPAFDTALSSILADPTFNRRTPSPDSVKEAVSDEFFPFQKRPKKKKAKTPALEDNLSGIQEHLKDPELPVNEHSNSQMDSIKDSAPVSEPRTPFEEHMTEYFPVGAAHPAAIHVPPPPPLPNLGEDEPLGKARNKGSKDEGLGLMGMRGLLSKSWAEQMEEEEESKAPSLEKGKGGSGGLFMAAVGAAVVGAGGAATLKHRGEREMQEVGMRGEGSSTGKTFSNAPKSSQESPTLPERPFSPPTQSKVSQLFPGLERVKRRTPSPRNFDQGVPKRRPSPVKQENNAVRLTQPIPSNWDTPGPVRDSAVTTNETPPMVVDPFHDAGRDSGYHDDSRRESTHGAGHILAPVPEVAAYQIEDPVSTSSASDNVAASPTESVTTTKQRSSALFQSSPGSTGTPGEPQRLADPAEVFPPQVTEPIKAPPETTKPHVSIFGDGVPRSADNPPQSLTPPRMWSPQPLDTIRENSPEDSPLAKKGRPLSDVGMPEHGLKAMRRTDTEDTEVPPALDEHHGPRKNIWKGKQAGKETESAQGASIGSDVAVLVGQRPSSAQSDRSAASKGEFGSIFARIKTPEMLSPAGSALTQRSATPPLRRINRAMSGDLRTASLLAEAKTSTRQDAQAAASSATTTTAGPSTYDRVHDKGKGRALTMNEEYEGWGDAPDTPLSPSRPPSIRKRQSMHIMDLETRLDQLVSENRLLQDAKARAEERQRDSTDRHVTEAIQARDEELRVKDAEIASINQTLASLREEIVRLTEVNDSLTAANKNLSEDTNQRYATLQAETQQAQEQYEQTTADLDLLQHQYRHLQAGVEGVVRDEVNLHLREKESEIARLHGELADATVQIKKLQQQILGSKQGETFLEFRDEDYFDQACQQLCQHVQQWVLRFSKFSDTRACRLSSEVRDEKIETRLDNSILDGTDVDMLLADRVRRRDVFMSVVMTMIWEYVFTRYLFGMDREQRQKLKALEKQLSEVGPQHAVAQWRAITLTLLARRENFQYQRAQDTEAVVQEIYNTLSALLPPPSNLVDKVLDSLRNVMRLAVDLSIEMRTQRAEYIMLPPLQPEYDKHGDLLRKVHFKASLMNERSGETTSNADLEAAHAVVKIVLFPLVVKKGDDLGDGEDEIVVCPAQVLTAKQARDRKVVRVLSGAMEIDDRRSAGNASRASALPADEGIGSVVDIEGGF